MDQWEEMPKIEKLKNPILVHNVVKVIAKNNPNIGMQIEW
jgi:hypothetical protein